MNAKSTLTIVSALALALLPAAHASSETSAAANLGNALPGPGPSASCQIHVAQVGPYHVGYMCTESCPPGYTHCTHNVCVVWSDILTRSDCWFNPIV